jgi:hypothetical protein
MRPTAKTPIPERLAIFLASIRTSHFAIRGESRSKRIVSVAKIVVGLDFIAIADVPLEFFQTLKSFSVLLNLCSVSGDTSESTSHASLNEPPSSKADPQKYSQGNFVDESMKDRSNLEIIEHVSFLAKGEAAVSFLAANSSL